MQNGSQGLDSGCGLRPIRNDGRIRAMETTAPLFHADHVGSLLRPPELLAAREVWG
ncbi:MAG: hypothetical protein HYY48_01485 [Gammaproteobacteria bacterium]|nr:hypothetical protein [Gammaproteobacteria bacterium]